MENQQVSKLIFLDFDGVLNSHQHVLMLKERGLKDPPGVNPGDADNLIREANIRAITHNFDEQNVWNLRYILKNVPDLKIVLSTAWRLNYEMEELKEGLSRVGVDPDRVIGKTDKKMSSSRGEEVSMYLREHFNISRDNKGTLLWKVLDDKWIFSTSDPYKEEHECMTDQLVGLTYRDAVNLILYFNPDFKPAVILM